MSRTAQRRLAKAEAESLCTGCMEPLGDCKPIRLCHPKCFTAFYRGMKSGKVTEKELVETGRMGEKSKPGRKPTNPVSIELAERNL